MDDRTSPQNGAKAADKSADKSGDKSGDNTADKSADKSAGKSAEKSADKSGDKSADKSADKLTGKRGFAAMDTEQQRAIASRGGQAAHQKGTAHEFNSEEARRAGQKGGEAVSRDRAHMSAIGRKGGESRQSATRQNQQQAQMNSTGNRDNEP